VLQSIIYFNQPIQKYWNDENYFGYIYLIWDQKHNKGYVGKKEAKIEKTLNYFGSGSIIKKKIKSRGTYFLKKIILGVCYSREELEFWETECKDFFNVLDPLYGYNILREDTGGDTMTNNPNKKEIFEKIKITINNPEWIKNIKIPAIKKGVEIRIKNNSYICCFKGETKETDERLKKSGENQKITKGNPEWKETKGKESTRKKKETESDPIWKATIGKKANEKHSETAQIKGSYKGAKNSRAKAVINIDTGLKFGYIQEAATFYKENRYAIRDCCEGKRETCVLGFHWKYL